jgi:hypothetical protein
MEGFEIRVGFDFIHVWPEEVFGFPDQPRYFGGYDAQGRVEIQCGPYHVYGSLEFSTGDIWEFYTELLKAYNDLAGKAVFQSGEGNLQFTITFRSRGHLTMVGMYQAILGSGTQLLFEMNCDQSYLIEPLAQLAEFVAKYGDNRGLAQ